MEERETVIIDDFLGINRRISPVVIRHNEATEILNIDLSNRSLDVRAGWDSVADTGAADNIVGIFQGFNNILVWGTTVLYKLVGSTFTAIGPLTANSILSFVSYNGLDLFVNGSAGDVPLYWDGVGAGALADSPPKADDIEVWRNHVFLTGLADPNQGEVRFSELENPNLWPAGHFLRPSKREEGANLICSKIVPFPGEEDGTRLAVFAKDRIYHFDGFTKSLFQIYLVKKGLGTACKRGHVNAEGLHYWFTEMGFFCTPDGGYTVNNISWNIQPYVNLISSTYYHLIQAHHVRHKRQIWWAVSMGGVAYNNRILVYNYGRSTPMEPAGSENARHVWSMYESDSGTAGFGSIAQFYNATASRYGTMIGEGNAAAKGGLVYAYEEGDGTDNGVNIAWRYQTPMISPTNVTSRQIVVRKMSMYYDSLSPPASLDVEMFPELEEAGNVTQSITLSTGGFSRVADTWWNAQTHNVLFDLTGTVGADKILSIKRLEVGFKQLRGTK